MFLLATILNFALLTSGDVPESDKPDDRFLLEALHKYEIEAHSVDWKDEGIDWTKYQVAMVFSTWDYHKNCEQFLKRLREIEAMGVKVLNPPEIITWNADKIYFRDLEALGLNIIESVYLAPSELQNLRSILEQKGWDECVIKPQISASGHNTHRFNLSTIQEVQTRLALLNSNQQYIVQPFAQEIIDEGEWSFVFFDKEYLHCVLKKPSEGHFLVQKGTKVLVQPPEWMIQEAQRMINTLDLPCLQTRLDVIRRETGKGKEELFIMEIEMIEPNLYLARNPKSVEHIARKLYEMFR